MPARAHQRLGVVVGEGGEAVGVLVERNRTASAAPRAPPCRLARGAVGLLRSPSRRGRGPPGAPALMSRPAPSFFVTSLRQAAKRSRQARIVYSCMPFVVEAGCAAPAIVLDAAPSAPPARRSRLSRGAPGRASMTSWPSQKMSASTSKRAPTTDFTGNRPPSTRRLDRFDRDAAGGEPAQTILAFGGALVARLRRGGSLRPGGGLSPCVRRQRVLRWCVSGPAASSCPSPAGLPDLRACRIRGMAEAPFGCTRGARGRTRGDKLTGIPPVYQAQSVLRLRALRVRARRSCRRPPATAEEKRLSGHCAQPVAAETINVAILP